MAFTTARAEFANTVVPLNMELIQNVLKNADGFVNENKESLKEVSDYSYGTDKDSLLQLDNVLPFDKQNYLTELTPYYQRIDEISKKINSNPANFKAHAGEIRNLRNEVLKNAKLGNINNIIKRKSNFDKWEKDNEKVKKNSPHYFDWFQNTYRKKLMENPTELVYGPQVPEVYNLDPEIAKKIVTDKSSGISIDEDGRVYTTLTEQKTKEKIIEYTINNMEGDSKYQEYIQGLASIGHPNVIDKNGKKIPYFIKDEKTGQFGLNPNHIMYNSLNAAVVGFEVNNRQTQVKRFGNDGDKGTDNQSTAAVYNSGGSITPDNVYSYVTNWKDRNSELRATGNPSLSYEIPGGQGNQIERERQIAERLITPVIDNLIIKYKNEKVQKTKRNSTTMNPGSGRTVKTEEVKGKFVSYKKDFLKYLKDNGITYRPQELEKYIDSNKIDPVTQGYEILNELGEEIEDSIEKSVAGYNKKKGKTIINIKGTNNKDDISNIVLDITNKENVTFYNSNGEEVDKENIPQIPEVERVAIYPSGKEGSFTLVMRTKESKLIFAELEDAFNANSTQYQSIAHNIQISNMIKEEKDLTDQDSNRIYSAIFNMPEVNGVRSLEMKSRSGQTVRISTKDGDKFTVSKLSVKTNKWIPYPEAEGKSFSEIMAAIKAE